MLAAVTAQLNLSQTNCSSSYNSRPSLEILKQEYKTILIALRPFSHIHVHTSSVLRAPSDEVIHRSRSQNMLALRSHHTPECGPQQRGRGEHTHSRAPCDAVGREVPTHSWHVGLCSAAGGVEGRSPAHRPHLLWGEVSGREGLFSQTLARISFCTRVQGPFTDWWQRADGSSEFLPSCFQTAGKEVNEYTEGEECDWGTCQ